MKNYLSAIQRGKTPPVLILDGPSAVGKTTFARNIVRLLSEEAEEMDGYYRALRPALQDNGPRALSTGAFLLLAFIGVEAGWFFDVAQGWSFDFAQGVAPAVIVVLAALG